MAFFRISVANPMPIMVKSSNDTNKGARKALHEPIGVGGRILEQGGILQISPLHRREHFLRNGGLPDLSCASNGNGFIGVELFGQKRFDCARNVHRQNAPF